MSYQTNKQNEHILKKLEAVKSATRTLIKEGFTVTHIEVEGVHPRISLLNEPRRLNQLPVSMKAMRRTPRGYETEVTACIDGCEVRWLESA